ncbi:hypothetical protein [Agromyces aureus]|uniref:Uncharacterized protein n=1 Tax=Agromyces aureus TaxID=453304 RepID=A0A191WJZ0_9MICO|nr:hypothetical protein [Agromyces aureus]ANJ28547.1 hypothetical protein ATC03_19430 [Agromyces aureus]
MRESTWQARCAAEVPQQLGAVERQLRLIDALVAETHGWAAALSGGSATRIWCGVASDRYAQALERLVSRLSGATDALEEARDGLMREAVQLRALAAEGGAGAWPTI